MANSKLKGRKWRIPPKYLKHLRAKLSAYNGNKKIEGYTRLKNLVQSGVITYENLKNIKHILEKYIDNEKMYNLNGGKEFHNWIDEQLGVARNSIESLKKTKRKSGIDNAYKKEHNKDSSKNPTKVRTPKLHKSTSSNDISNNNVNYENKSTLKVVITESQYKSIVKENDDYVEKLLNLIKSGQSENISLALEIAKANGIPVAKIVQQYEPFISLVTYGGETLQERLVYLFNTDYLSITGERVTKIPEGIGDFKNLKSLNIRRAPITSIPESIGNLNNLARLTIEVTGIDVLPSSIGNLKNLQTLELNENKLIHIPESIAKLPKLTHLYLYNNNLESLPQGITQSNLEYLSFPNNNISVLPDLYKMKNIMNLNIADNPTINAYEVLSKINYLDELYTRKNGLTEEQKINLKNSKKFARSIIQ